MSKNRSQFINRAISKSRQTKPCYTRPECNLNILNFILS